MSILAAALLTIVVDISDQSMDVYEGWEHVSTYAVSTGKPGFETPTGEYLVYLKKPVHYSRKYDGAKMPYAMFFRGGYAIHAGRIPEPRRPASHGCVRLKYSDAKSLYQLAQGVPAQVVVRP